MKPNDSLREPAGKESTMPDAPVLIDDKDDSRKLLVAFGGIKGGLGMPVFEFFQLTRQMEVKKIFIRDLEQSWYQKGLPGIGNDFASIVEYLNEFAARNKIEKTVFVGNSMGGWAALAAGLLFEGNNSVLAFSPQTFIGKWRRMLYRDRRWEEQILRARKNSQNSFFDIKGLFRRSRTNPPISIYYSELFNLDKIHADRLANFSNVKLFGYAFPDHKLIQHLKNSQKLAQILNDAFGING